MTIPGVREAAAAALLAEIGVEMSRFPTAAHRVSWAGLCPRMDESAGKRRATRLRKGAPWLKPVLVQCAWGAARTKRTYTQAQFLRLKARRGPMKAVVAVAATILTAAYYVLRDAWAIASSAPTTSSHATALAWPSASRIASGSLAMRSRSHRRPELLRPHSRAVRRGVSW